MSFMHNGKSTSSNEVNVPWFKSFNRVHLFCEVAAGSSTLTDSFCQGITTLDATEGPLVNHSKMQFLWNLFYSSMVPTEPSSRHDSDNICWDSTTGMVDLPPCRATESCTTAVGPREQKIIATSNTMIIYSLQL